MVVGELLGGLQSAYDAVGVRDDRKVGSVPDDLCAADRNDLVVVLVDLALGVVERKALEEDDGVVVADRRLEQAAGIGRIGRAEHLQAGDVGEPGVEALGMLGGQLVAAAAGSADDERAARLTPEHVA